VTGAGIRPDIKTSRGSKHLIELARAANIEMQIFAE
jgi:DNA-binding sugar fermentation-stimulating protein